MADSLARISTALYCLCWPFIKLLQGVASVLSPFWAILRFIFLPITIVVQGIVGVLLWPFRLQVLERFETIYIYLGIAALIGICAGFVVHVVSSVLTSGLRIDGSRQKSSRTNGRTVKSYRDARKRRIKGPEEEVSTPVAVKDEGAGSAVSTGTRRKQRGLLRETIIEEEDSDF